MDAGAKPTVADVEDLIGMGTWLWDPSNDTVSCSAGLGRVLPVDDVGGIDSLIRCLHPQDQLAFRAHLDLLCEGEAVTGEYRVPSDGSLRWVECRARLRGAATGGARHVFGTFRDITTERLFLDALADAAIRDPLTGLLNRFAITDRLDHALDRLRRHEHQVAVMFVDLDGLKTVNDELGHQQGDDVIRALAARMTESVRLEDSVGRYGGDEFVVVCEDIATPSDALLIGNRIVEALRLESSLGGSFTVTTSVGVTAANRGDRGADVLARADAAMYEAKRGGGGRVVFRD